MNVMLGLRPGVPVRRSALDLDSLPLSPGAQGLEGTVVRTLNTPFLCKLFAVPRGVEGGAAVQQLIDFREGNASGPDREILRSTFSWPLHRVLDDASLATIGVLIPAAPPRFWFEHGGAMHLREAQHLPRAVSVAGTMDAPARVRFLADLGEAWDVLGRNGLVYGDANSRNIVYAASGWPTAFILDCDGIRPDGDPAMGFRAQANWTDPYSVRVNTRQSDCYLYALWVLRTLTGSMIPAPSTPVDAQALPRTISRHRGLARQVARALSAPGGRPSPGTIAAELRSL